MVYCRVLNTVPAFAVWKIKLQTLYYISFFICVSGWKGDTRAMFYFTSSKEPDKYFIYWFLLLKNHKNDLQCQFKGMKNDRW